MSTESSSRIAAVTLTTAVAAALRQCAQGGSNSHGPRGPQGPSTRRGEWVSVSEPAFQSGLGLLSSPQFRSVCYQGCDQRRLDPFGLSRVGLVVRIYLSRLEVAVPLSAGTNGATVTFDMIDAAPCS